MFDVLRRHPAFRRLWAAQVVSQAGDWLGRVAVLALIARLDQESATRAFGLLFATEVALRLLPTALLAPLAGSLSDRLPRRMLMITADVLRGLIVLGFLFVDTRAELPLLYGLMLAQMCVSAFFEAARSGAVPSTVSRADLHTAYALSAVTWSMMLAVGAVAGGLLLGPLGVRGVLLVDAASYGVSALLLLGLHLPPVAQHPEPFRWRDVLLLTELRRAWRHLDERGARVAVTAKWYWSVAGGYLVLLSVLGARRFAPAADEGGAPTLAGTGLAISVLYAARGVGTGLGPVVARALTGSGDRALLRCTLVGFLVAAGGYALVPFANGLYVAALLVALAHTGGSTIWVSSTTFWQRRADDAFRGRAHSLEFTGTTIGFTIWGFAAGLGYDALGSADPVLWGLAAATVVAGFAWWRGARTIAAPALEPATPSI